MLIITFIGLATLLLTPATSLFSGFDDNPASGALQTQDSVMFDDNPAANAVDAVPRSRRESPRIEQRTRVSANASTNATGDVTQNTSTTVNDRLQYRPQRSFDNVFVTQDAQTRINQDCRSGESCRQHAESDINQRADINLDSRFTNVFVTQNADSRINQDCRAREDCDQTADQRFNQDANIDGHWSSNGFANSYRHGHRTTHQRESARLQ